MKKILAAKILKGHGVHGVLKIGVYLENFENYYKKLMDDKENPIEILSCSILDQPKKYYLVKLPGINKLEDTLAYIGRKWFIPENQLAPLDNNNYYYHEIIGLPVVDMENNPVGVVSDMDNMGAGDIIIINLNINRLVYLPFDEYMFPNLEKNKVTISNHGLEYIFEE
jgi:16S rRNA processing protein RimM